MLEQELDEQRLLEPRDAAALGADVAHGTASASCGDWVDAQLSRIELLLCSPVEPAAVARLLLHELAPLVNAAQAAAYVLASTDATELVLAAGYAAGDGLPRSVALGEGLLGQCAAARRKLVVGGVSAEYFRVRSALGTSAPAQLAFVPVALESGALAVLELAFVGSIESASDALLERLAQRQPPAGELHTEHARSSAAAQRATGEASTLPNPSARNGFWSTLSHELRSPLNSVIVLSHVLAENAEHNLTDKQVTLARVIHGSGKDLLSLVDNLSLMAKLEAQRLILAPSELELGALRRSLLRVCAPLAAARGLRLSIELEPEAPLVLFTDATRVRQVIECMLARAIESAEDAEVRLRIGVCHSGWSPSKQRLNGARSVLAFVVDVAPLSAAPSPRHSAPSAAPGAAAIVADGAPADEVEGGPPSLGALARGGPLGLAISGELADWLGGELRSASGSHLTLFLPASGRESASTALGALPLVAAPRERAPDRAADAPAAPSAVAFDAPSQPPPGQSPPAEGERQHAATPAALRADDLDGFEILLADSDVRQAFALTGWLERHGAVVVHAEDLVEVVERLAGRPLPSAVLLDARVLAAGPEPAVQRLLRLGEQTPLVVLREAADAATSLPHVHRLPRPVDARELVALLRRVAIGGRSLHTRAR